MVKVDTIDLLESEVQKAEELLHSGQSKAALSYYVNILQHRLSYCIKTSELPGAADLVVMERVVDLSTRCGELESAEKLLTAMIGFCEVAQYRYGMDYLTVKLGQLALVKGDLNGCRESLRKLTSRIGLLEEIIFTAEGLGAWELRVQSEDMDTADRAVFFVDIYLLLGEFLSALGQYGDALGALRSGLNHTTDNASDRIRRTSSRLRLAMVVANLEAGDTFSAGQLLDQVQPEIDPASDLGLHSMWLEMSGHLALLMGRLGPAIEHFETLVSYCVGGEFDRAARFAMLNLAQVLILLNQTARARDILAGLSKDVEIDEGISKRAGFLYSLAEARAQSLAEGVPISPSVIEMWRGRQIKEGNNHVKEEIDPLDLPQASGYLTFFEDRALAFQWTLAKRDLNRAQIILEEIKESFQYSDSKLIHMRLGVLSALLHYYKNEYQLAEELLTILLTAFEKRGLKPELWQLLRVLGWCKIALGRPAQECQSLSKQCADLLEEISTSLDSTARAIYLLNKWTADEERLAGWIDQLISKKLSASQGNLWVRFVRRISLARAIAELSDHLDDYRAGLAEDAIDVKFNRRFREGSLGFVNRLLHQSFRQRTLSFLVLPDRVLVIQSGFLKLDFGVSALTRIRLRELVARWHELAQSANGTRDLGDTRHEARHLGDYESQQNLIGNHLSHALQIDQVIETLPKRIRLLRLLPDDSLHGLPFAALPVNGQLMVNRVATYISYDSSSRSQRNSKEIGGYRLLAGVSNAAGLPPLHGVPKELLQVSLKLASRGKCIALLDDEVNKIKLMNLLPEVDLFHIACHGVFKPDQPDASGFVIADKYKQTETLTLRDISSLNLSRMRHATLSSCWSADSFIMPGRIIISLPETLWYAGVGSVLASLWPVDDRSAIAFTSRFYELLKYKTRAEALRLTQIECAEGKLSVDWEQQTNSSYYWAGFVLYGDEGRLSI